MVHEKLKNAPSLRVTGAGRCLVRWLGGKTVGSIEWKQYVEKVPVHWVQAVIELARRNSNTWREIVEHLERQRV